MSKKGAVVSVHHAMESVHRPSRPPGTVCFSTEKNNDYHTNNLWHVDTMPLPGARRFQSLSEIIIQIITGHNVSRRIVKIPADAATIGKYSQVGPYNFMR